MREYAFIKILKNDTESMNKLRIRKILMNVESFLIRWIHSKSLLIQLVDSDTQMNNS